jgi:hypothetical protein
MVKKKIIFTIFIVWCLVNLFSSGCSRPESQPKSQPASGENAPKAMAKIDIITPADNSELEGVEHLVRGKVTDYSMGNVFVLVHPMRTNLFWVQRPPSLINQDGLWQTICFFGTKTQGIGEYFELIAIITNKTMKEGDTLQVIPTDVIKSPLITVKRTE